ncbi:MULTISPECIES: ROK family transcriptional regulator [unclassified Modestobacter]|uniref:ROK family transcriptional regulator n=1 Tax=unclassified Modestobacter TaxID=2643866 RepID=UPI0022AB01BE|nr:MULTISPECIES: ROK family transcriptional regulator [unclassified Modestobacter]MCZ2825654.1 ROK family transcriptional regulator [Modestobacter sp. VKM Ac-2981]MCZ2853281.1 ROK family transcriptional regulator [Modestobacter sp. VKM Ac-2982]
MTAVADPPQPRRALRSTAKVLPEHARASNRSMVLQLLFHAGPRSRAELARATGLTRVTISDLVASLLAQGLVTELGQQADGKVGKPGTLVGLDAEAFQIVAVDLADDERVHGAVLDLSGAVRERRTAPVGGCTGAAAVEVLLGLCRELVAATTRPVLGVGVGSPGVIDLSGRVLQAPNRGWYDLPLAEQLSAALELPVHVANDADTAALGEFTWGGASGNGLLVLTVGGGVGAGIVLDGALVQGNEHAAGELGHVTALDERDEHDRAPLGRPELCACGRRGCLETVLSVPAMRRRIAGLDAAGRNDALASVGRRLGIVLAPVVSALNLSEVVLCGPEELLGGPLRDAALATLRERTIPVVSSHVQLRMTSLGEHGALSGAAVLVLSGQLGVT